MGHRPFKWIPHDGGRHAISINSHPGDDTQALCGVDVPKPAGPLPVLARCWPTCQSCDTAWREHEGIPTYPRPDFSIRRT
ncbi:zinc finger protein [Actinosynnema pretiosum]|uniref:Zinc-finger domain-containing protein n=1 Tax=Actinosynnema pretiosum TaxID=42197 RepID=A0A290Z1E6_9PSEU|nr:zinc finger protein [Actinosynnema pretiosum]ATE52812.1 hypothetical protein CNX65_05545 [Actinosynnema pretiosum]